VTDGARRLDLDVDAPHGGVLLLSDAYHPAWKAWVNGEPAPVYRANLALRAVMVPPGPSRVTFRYRPVAVLVSWGLSLLGLGVCGALALWPHTGRRLPPARAGGLSRE
jgi:uncharacterized membrane protein YfhO